MQEYIENLDILLPRLMRSLNNNDVLIITADHGSDVDSQNALTREHVPVLFFSRQFKPTRLANLGVRRTFADVAETIARIYEIEHHFGAESFYEEVNPQAASYVID